MNGFDAYTLFLALKQHFTSPTYDYVKYNGKIKTSIASYEKRKDVHTFRKLGVLPDPKTRIIASLASDITWINDVVGAQGAKAESDYQKTVQSFSYVFKSFLDAIDKPLKTLLVKTGNQYPLLAELYISDKVPTQFVIVLDDLLGFLPKWNQDFDEIMWDPYKHKITKLRSLFVYEKAKAKKIFLEWAEKNQINKQQV